MDPRLASMSRRRFFLARTLNGCARPIHWCAKTLTGWVSSIVAESRRQESIASRLWADAIAAGKQSEAPR